MDRENTYLRTLSGACGAPRGRVRESHNPAYCRDSRLENESDVDQYSQIIFFFINGCS